MGGEGGQDARAEFQAFIASKRSALVKAAEKLLNDPAEAEDVVQDTLTAVWRRIGDRPPRKVRAYVFRAVQLNALKRRARRRRHLSLEAVPELPTERSQEDENPDRVDPLTLEAALEGLPQTQQAVLRMKYYVGLTFREIGAALSISANTASSRCRYALAALRKAIARRQEEQKSRKGG